MISIFSCVINACYAAEQVIVKKLSKYLTAALVLMSFVAVATTTTTTTDQWQTVELKLEDGLPDLTVYSMEQDQSGYMWFGTTNGLARYDGYSFKVFRHDGTDPNTLSNNNAGNIFLDSNNHLWIGTFGGGANVYNLNNGTLQRLPYSNTPSEQVIAENVQTFFEDSQGHMWIGTGSGLYQIIGDKLNYYGKNNRDKYSLGKSRVWDIEEDSQGHIWLGTSRGLSELNVSSGIFNHFSLPEELTSNISSNQFRELQMVDDVLWIGSSTGLYSFNVNSKHFSYYPSNNKILKINDIHVEDDGYLLIATMEGMYEYNPMKQVFRVNENNELWQAYSHLDIRQIHRDRSGLLWLATRDSGVLKIDQAGGLFKLHTEYVADSQLTEKSKQVWSTDSDAFNHLLVGTSDTVFKQTLNSNSSRVVVDGMDAVPGIIRSIEKRKAGGFWIAASSGLYGLAINSDQAEIRNEPFELAGIEPADVFSVTESINGDVWLALYNLGILHWSPTKQTADLIQFIDGHSLTDTNISVIYVDKQQHIWIGSNLIGVFRYDPASKAMELFSHEFGNSKSITSNRIKDIYQDRSDRLWVATARGLNQFQAESRNFKRYTKEDGLLSDSVSSIHEDSQQNLWIVYKFGLSKFNPDKQEINNYVLNESVSNDGFTTRSSSIDVNDVIYIGSVNGYYSFDPRLIKKHDIYQPLLKVTQVWVNNQPLHEAQWSSQQLQFDLYHGDQNIAFEFAALDFKSPEQIKYEYRIMGMSEKWLNISRNRLIELKHLYPGTYEVEVQASNNDGRWTEQKMSIELNIHPVWWNQGWIRVMIASFIVIGAFLIHRLRTHKIRQQNLLLENEVKSRTSELHDLNTQLETAANTDYLTKLPNRMAFIKTIEYKQQHQQINGSGCIVMADIDFFKQINDKYGHAAGDFILVEISQMMREMIRQDDLIARWGGEEFIFYFEGKSAQHILPMINRIRETVEQTQFKFNQQIIPVTLTLGIGQNQPGLSLNECIAQADEAMYQGKADGRNSVRVAGLK